MEQAMHWMWTKRKNSLNSCVFASSSPSYGDSWEEKAFAEDAAGALGGYIWPPRSYSCSFCRREFRSAQALGGHMNVHRRDRARLKQFPSPNGELVQNPNSGSSTSRVTIPPTQVNCNEKTLVPSFSSPTVQKRTPILISSSPSWSTLVGERYFHVPYLMKEEKNSRILDWDCRAKGDYVAADLSMSCKRRRTDETLSFFPKSSSIDSHPQSEVIDLSPSSIDLELRLGDRPNVK